jgi:hypothetical protein
MRCAIGTTSEARSRALSGSSSAQTCAVVQRCVLPRGGAGAQSSSSVVPSGRVTCSHCASPAGGCAQYSERDPRRFPQPHRSCMPRASQACMRRGQGGTLSDDVERVRNSEVDVQHRTGPGRTPHRYKHALQDQIRPLIRPITFRSVPFRPTHTCVRACVRAHLCAAVCVACVGIPSVVGCAHARQRTDAGESIVQTRMRGLCS